MSTVADDTIDSLDGVPSSRKPKSVASIGLGQKLLVTPLPSYSGPYSVGYMEVEVAVRVPRSFSHIRRNHKPLLSLETVLFSLYYPCRSDLRKSSFLEAHRKSSNPTWLPHPRFEVGKSYARFAGFRKWPTIAFLAGTTMSTKLPAYRNAILADHFAPDQDSEEAGPEMPVFPLMIFSHGLGGTRTTYSSMCGEFASHGFVVCALEHRDGSGPSTFVNSPSEETQDAPGMGEGKDKSDRTNSRRLDYVFPEGNADDTRPSNERGIDAELRTAQTQLRLAEIEEAYFVLSMIQKGEGKHIADKNLRRSGNIGSSSQGLDGVDWPLWTGRLHLEQVTIAGHSFGGATTVEVLRHTERFQFVGQGIIYDIWGAAIQPPEERRNRIQRPFLCINSEAFMYWSSNFKAVFTLCEEAKANGALSWLMTVRGTVHLSLSDFPVLYPRIFSLLYKATANSHRAILLHVSASIEFLRLIMPQNTSAISPRTNEKLLNLALLKDLPDERKPTNEKWIAMRLRIPHEMALRLKPRVIRRHINRKHARQAGTVIPTDPTGKEIYALQDLGVGEEVWMHFAPSQDELASLGSDPRKGLGTEE